MKDNAEKAVGRLLVTTDVVAGLVVPSKNRSQTIPAGTNLLCLEVKRNDVTVLFEEKVVEVTKLYFVCPLDRTALNGYKFCLTGANGLYSKSAITNIIQLLGGVVEPSPKRATHILKGEIDTSVKLSYARECKVPIMTYDEFWALLKDSIITFR